MSLGAVHIHLNRLRHDWTDSVATVIVEGVEEVSVVKWTIGLAVIGLLCRPGDGTVIDSDGV